MLLTVVEGNGNKNSQKSILITHSDRGFSLTSSEDTIQRMVEISALTPVNLKYPWEVINKILGPYSNYGKVMITEQAMELVNHICDMNRIFF